MLTHSQRGDSKRVRTELEMCVCVNDGKSKKERKFGDNTLSLKSYNITNPEDSLFLYAFFRFRFRFIFRKH